MEVLLTGVLVVLTGYTFIHPSAENGQYAPVVHNGQVYRLNTRDGTFERCEPPVMKCTPTTLQIQDQTKNSTQNQ